MTTFVKIFYTTTILIFLHFSASAQYRADKWEVGVSVIPFTADDEPYMFLVKRHLNNTLAIRLGVGAKYEIKEESHSHYRVFTHLEGDPFQRWNYETQTSSLKSLFFLGLQYGKRQRKIQLYGATDLLYMYDSEDTEIPGLVNFPDGITIPPYERFALVDIESSISRSVGVRQSIGVTYLITDEVSVSIEGGLTFFLHQVEKEVRSTEVQSNATESAYVVPGRGVSEIPLNSSVVIRPVSLIALSYHF